MRDKNLPSDGGLWPDAQANGWSHAAEGTGGFRQSVSGDGRRDLRESSSRHDGVLPKAGQSLASAGTLLRGGERASGAGRADGGPFGAARIGGAHGRLGFDETVPPNGYAWWYVDAFSADHRFGLTIIAFIGSVFSPYYAKQRRLLGHADPAQHCSLNVAVYGPGVGRWAMTERCKKALKPSADGLAIGPSAVMWDGARLRIEIDEQSPYRPSPLRGVVTLEPEIVPNFATDFGTGGRHSWAPLAPRAHVEVRLESPALSWNGTGYFDMNRGNEPLEDGFSYWNWSRACLPKKAAILYDVVRAEGDHSAMGIEIAADGAVSLLDASEHCVMGRTPVWKMPRETRCDKGHAAHVAKTFEDAPFYSRSMIATRLLGEPVKAMHESISLDRFRKRWVQSLLRFRMPRVSL